MWGLLNMFDLVALLIKCLSMVAVMSKSAITPSFSGRTATMEPGVRPIISLACVPTAKTVSERMSTATTDGSRITIPFPFMNTKVLAVPKSIPISFANMDVPLSFPPVLCESKNRLIELPGQLPKKGAKPHSSEYPYYNR